MTFSNVKEERSIQTPPYCLDTVESIREAQNIQLLNLRPTHFDKMINFAHKYSLEVPSALKCAKKCVRKTFYVVKKMRVRNMETEYEIASNLHSVERFGLIEERVPWVTEIIDYTESHSFVSFTNSIYRDVHLITSNYSFANQFEVFKEIAKKELRVLMKTGNTQKMAFEDLRKLISLYALFDNEDILQAIRMAKDSDNETLYENALYEFVLARLSRYMHKLLLVDRRVVPAIRNKLIAKMAKLNAPTNCKIAVYTMLKKYHKVEDLPPILDKIKSLLHRFPIENDIKKKLKDHIESIKKEVNCAKLLYGKLFLTKDTTGIQKLYKTRNILKSKLSYRDYVVKEYTQMRTVSFYPVKDYLLVVKNLSSRDCSDKISDMHLQYSKFFAIRIFHNDIYVGNIYLIDYTEDTSCILIDRIQIPRRLFAVGHNFFENLTAVLTELFSQTNWQYILLPEKTISNHSTIQRLYNTYKYKLHKKRVLFKSEYRAYFESLKDNTEYYILCENQAKHS